jgi:hypothetical protein
MMLLLIFQHYLFSHFWFATVQLVLHADWQDAWHSPQPKLFVSFFAAGLLIVFICFIMYPSSLMHFFSRGFEKFVCA